MKDLETLLVRKKELEEEMEYLKKCYPYTNKDRKHHVSLSYEFITKYNKCLQHIHNIKININQVKMKNMNKKG